jgi:hypothetical protein
MKLKYKVLIVALAMMLLVEKCEKTTPTNTVDKYKTDTICKKTKNIYTIRKQ